MKYSKSTIVACVACVLLAIAVVRDVFTHKELILQNEELQDRLDRLTKQEQQSVVMQRVNAQMEEIANEERRISDEQREEAVEQRRQAEQERQNAEEQRRQAEQERQNALVAERRAVEASLVAQREQQQAEHQRAEAEYSKRVTDTLSYVTLARTLGNTAIMQYRAGNHELAEMIAYTAVTYTNRYYGDLYSPSIYQALAMASQNKNVWLKHKGSITDIAFSDDKSGFMITCSSYGEIMKHTGYYSGKLNSEMLVSNSRYDFRDLYIDRTTNTTYVLSRSGHLIVIDSNNKVKVIEIDLSNLRDLDVTDNQFIIFGEEGMALFDTRTCTVVEKKKLPFHLVYLGRSENRPIVFDREGCMHLIRSFNKIETKKVPFKGQVTAFAESKHKNLKAYGMSDGTIYVINDKGQELRLTGHQSRISKLKADGYRLYSASYDGTVNLWLMNMPKIDPMTLFTTKGWIINFTFDLKKTSIWSGDQNGNLTSTLISIPAMADRLKRKVKRNFTRDEWNYYIGSNVAYEKFKN